MASSIYSDMSEVSPRAQTLPAPALYSFKTGIQQTYLYKQIRWFVSLLEERISPAVLA